MRAARDIINQMTLTKERKVLFENFLSLSFLQAASYLLPLITLPYLVRVLGPEKFGLIAFAQALIQYFVVFTDYGFNYSATRDISVNREDPDTVSGIFNAVMVIKLFFSLMSLVACLALVLYVPKFKANWPVYLCTFGTVLGNALFPVWFLQGMERMKYITFLNIFGKTIFTVAIFVFVRKQQDYLLVPLLSSLGYIVTGLASLRVVFSIFKIKFVFPSYRNIRSQLVGGFHIYLSTAAVSLYTNSIIVILGLFATDVVVGYYSAAEKIIKAVQTLSGPISQSVYPFISRLAVSSREQALRFLRKCGLMMGVGGFAISILIFISADLVVKMVLGDAYQRSIVVLRILAFIPFIVGVATVYANFFLLGFGYSKVWAKIIITCGLTSIALSIVLIYFMSYIGAAISWVITEICVLVFSYIAYSKRRYGYC